MVKISVFLLIVCLSLLCSHVAAAINVTPVSVGQTYIVWQWDTGLTLTDMYIDGNLMCGYETTDNNYAMVGINPNERHNITIYTSTDTGGNITYTLPKACTNGGGASCGASFEVDRESPVPNLLPIIGIFVAGLAYTKRKL